MDSRRRLSAILLLAPLALGPVATRTFGQEPAAAPAQSGAELATATIAVPDTLLGRQNAGLAQLPAAIQALTGAKDVACLSNPPSIIVRGTPKQVEDARNYVAELAARAAADAALRQRQTDDARGKSAIKDLIEIDFNAGTVRDYLMAVQTASGFRNVVVAQDELYDLPMPSVRLSGVSPEAAVRVLESLPLSQSNARAWIRLHEVGATRQSSSQQPVFVAVLEKEPAQGTAKRPPVLVRVFDLSPLQKYEPEQLKALLEAIGVGIELASQSDSFATKFHPTSGLFFVKGTPGDIDVVEQSIEKKIGRVNRESSPPAAGQPAPETKLPTPPAKK